MREQHIDTCDFLAARREYSIFDEPPARAELLVTCAACVCQHLRDASFHADLKKLVAYLTQFDDLSKEESQLTPSFVLF